MDHRIASFSSKWIGITFIEVNLFGASELQSLVEHRLRVMIQLPHCHVPVLAAKLPLHDVADVVANVVVLQWIRNQRGLQGSQREFALSTGACALTAVVASRLRW